ncbi:tRNA pseudouridine(55) synthase TruB [Rubrivivax gelatinosus]|uniref:tRNA pseudouridine synthase B n=1 Tax=Rubrivivax gelatinosus TaxID=28068 RepID=A0A4R2MB70_RUBGE|nr:tRNA pseudouridine(55) synthase TruB [Rubrivivax gelatinosus]MBK1688675.1 tRNA pseudouridine(55) synthase TruB [Rubrivivax gelatinosus]TCP04609.1 tRNA pseudouridine synthase B [Rubrivivax gelatinosus]
MRNARPPRQPRRALHGVLLLDKPIGWTSNDALQKAKGILRAEKGGHTGTLDPLATGLLPLCFGAATKFSQASLDADKRYTATLHLGRTTSTGDLEGEVLEERPVECDRAAIAAVLARFTGEIDQLPPMHSALKHEGRALYDYARAGVEVERTPRRVTIRSLAVLDWTAPTLVLDVLCTKGTYVRTLAEDIGRALGCGAHLAALRRTASGALTLDGAVTIDELQTLTPAERDALIRPIDCLLADWPALRLADDEAGRFLSGQRRRTGQADASAVRVYGPDPRAFLGSAHITRGELIADRLLSPVEVAAQLQPIPPVSIPETATSTPQTAHGHEATT